MLRVTIDDVRDHIKEQDVIFSISQKDIQVIAEEAIERKLNQEEMVEICNYVLNQLIICDDWVKEIIIGNEGTSKWGKY